MSPRRVLAEHSSRELSEWMAYERAFGLGVDDDVRAGIIASAIWNQRGGLPTSSDGKHHRPATPGDFFPHLGAAEDEPDAPASHDAHDEPDVEPAVDEAAAATEALKSAWAAWGVKHNAAVRQASKLETGSPPDDPESN